MSLTYNMMCILYSVAATSFDDSQSAVVQTICIIQLIDTSNFLYCP